MADDREEKGRSELGFMMRYDKAGGDRASRAQYRQMERIQDRADEWGGTSYRGKRSGSIRYGRKNRRSTRD
jgi:hypothetical protein